MVSQHHFASNLREVTYISLLKGLKSILWILVVVGSVPYTRAETPPSEVHELAQAVDRHYNHLHSLKAQFTETYRGAGIDRTESGTVWLKKPGKMRWEYRSPREKLFLGDGKNAWFYVPGDQQATRTSMRKLDDLQSPLAFLLGKANLEKELQGLAIADHSLSLDASDVVLVGTPKTLADRVSRVQLEITPTKQIARILIEERDGSTTEYRFSQQSENVAIGEESFHFVPPAGVEVVEGEIGQ